MATKIRLLLSSLLVTALSAQQGPPPEEHWGGRILAPSNPELRGGFSFDRFTELSGTYRRYNEIDETMGFNQLYLSYTDALPSDPDLLFTVLGGVGLTANQPTGWFQNSYVHKQLGADPVPVFATRDATELFASVSLTKWLDIATIGSEEDRAVHIRGYGSVGYMASTLYSESYADLGGTILLPNLISEHHIKFAATNRFALPEEGDAFQDLASFSNVTQFNLAFIPSHIESPCFVLDALGNPTLGFTYTLDSGFFQRRGEPISERFAGFYLEWATGLRFETYNDFANKTDYGPTYGFQVSVDLFSLFKNNRLKW